MRRMMLFVTLVLVAAAMIAAGALPTFAKQPKTKGEGRGVGASACEVPGTTYPTIQSAVDDPSCQTIQLVGNSTESVTIDRNLTITGAGLDNEPIVNGESGTPVFTILPGNTVIFEVFQVAGGDASVEQGGGILNRGTLILEATDVLISNATDGGGIYNAGTLTLDGGSLVYTNNATNGGGGIYNAGTLTLTGGSSVFSNTATNGGGIYNAGTLYQCVGSSVYDNEAAPGTAQDIAGTPAQQCPTSPGPGGPPEGERVLVDHKGKKELCLPEAALKGHLKHGDEVIDEEGCSEESAAKKNGKAGRAGVVGSGGRTP
jgi:hypothetical protein